MIKKRLERMDTALKHGNDRRETSLAHQAVAHLCGMLCLAERGLTGVPLWQAAFKAGVQIMGRVPRIGYCGH